MTKSTLIPASVTRQIVAWVVIGLLTITIMKASTVAGQTDRVPVFQTIPTLNWNSTF